MVSTADCGSGGDTCVFAVVPGRDPIHLGADAAPLDCLAKALTDSLEPPYRAVGIRREGSTWAVGRVKRCG